MNRDEYYFIACAENLGLGYVDHPPVVPIIARFSLLIFGKNYIGLRFFSALAGALTVFFAGKAVEKLTGGRFAIILSSISIIISPVFLGANKMFCIPAFEIMIWTICTYILVLIINEVNPKNWILFGLLFGISVNTKYTTAFFGLILLIMFVILPQKRKLLRSKYFVDGLLVSFFLILPNFVWQINYGFPTYEFLSNLREGHLSNLSPLLFVVGQILYLHPFSLPIWGTGLYFCAFSKEGKRYKTIGWMYIIAFLTFTIISAKLYYLASAYPILIAFGSYKIEQIFHKRRAKKLKVAIPIILILGGLFTAPFAIPILPIETYQKYYNATLGHFLGDVREGSGDFYDMFGWELLANRVSNIYKELPEGERESAVIFADNYGKAASMEYYSNKYKLPPVLSSHNNYYLWGVEHLEKHSYSTVIVVGLSIRDKTELEKVFKDVELVSVVECEYCLESQIPVYICKNSRIPLKQIFIGTKHFN